MEAGLLALVLHVAGAQEALVFEHLGQHRLERHAPGLWLFGTIGVLHADKLVVGYVEGGAVLVAAVFGCVVVDAAQAVDVAAGAEHGGNDYLVERQALGGERVYKGARYLGEQRGGAWHEVGDGVGEAVHVVEGRVADIDEVFFPAHGFFAVCYARYADALGGGQLHVVEVGERLGEAAHAGDAVFHGLARAVGELQVRAGP